MKIRTVIFISAFLIAVFALAAGREAENTDEIKTIYLINKSKYGYENTAVLNGAKSAAKEYGVDLQVLAPDSETDLDMQKSLLEEAFANRSEGIIISPIDTVAITEKVSSLNKIDTKIVLINNSLSLSGGFESLGYDDEKLAYNIAFDMPLNPVDREPTINIYMSREGTRESTLILEGLKKIYGEEARYNVYENMSTEEHMYLAIVSKHVESGMDLAICLDESSLLGLAACKEILGEVPVIGINNSLEVLSAIDNEKIDKLYVFNYFDYGYRAVLRLINKERKDDFKDEYIVVNKNNLFDENIEKIIFQPY